MPSATMPPGGGVEYDNLWYTPQEWQASGIPQSLTSSIGTAPDSSTVDGQAALQTTLASYGLTGLNMSQVWSQYVASGSNLDYLLNTWLPTTPAFQSAFPAWETWSNQGGTVASYVAYQNTLIQYANQEGFTPGTVNQNTITTWINNGVSASEAQQRIQDASKATYSIDKNSQVYLQTRELGLTDGDLAAVFFDPDTAVPLLENKLAAAQVGGAAANAGINLDTGLANQLGAQGVSASQAAQGFGDITNQQQLYSALPGQTGPTINQGQQVGAEFGTNPNVAQQVKQIAAQRIAAFQTGGTVASTSAGFVGAGRNQGA